MLLLVDELDSVGVFVEPAAGDDFAVSGDGAHHAIDRQHCPGGIKQRAVKNVRSAKQSDVAPVVSEERAFAVDGVAACAVAGAAKERLPARRIANQQALRAESAHVA